MPLSLARITAPQTHENDLYRAAFIQKVQQTPIAVIQARMGFGKTVTVAQFVRTSGTKYAWYSLDATDSFDIFLKYLEKSIQKPHANFKFYKENLTDTSALATHFSNALFDLEEKIILVLDHVEYCLKNKHIKSFINHLLAIWPNQHQLILMTNTYFAVENYEKLSLKNQIKTITKTTLAFSQAEIELYIENDSELPVDETSVEKLLAHSQGWPYAVELLDKNHGDDSQILSYIDQLIITDLAQADFAMIERLALAKTFTLTDLENLFKNYRISDWQNMFKKYDFFILQDQHCSLEPLFHAYFLASWQKNQQKAYRDWQSKLANYFYEQGNLDQALGHMSESGKTAGLAEMLNQEGAFLIEKASFETYQHFYHQIDSSLLSQYYALDYYYGESLRYQSHYEAAQHAYNKCIEVAKAQNDAFYMSKSYAGIASIYLDTIQPVKAKSPLQMAIHWAGKSNKTEPKALEDLKRKYTENLVNLGNAHDAKVWEEKEKLSDENLMYGNLKARILLRMGELTAAEDVLLSTVQKQTILPDSHRETEVLLAFIYNLTGEIDQAFVNAVAGIETGQRIDSDFIQAVGYTRKGFAEMQKYPYLLTEAKQSIEKAIALMDALHVPRVQAEPMMALATIYAKQGDFETAIFYAKSALRETDAVQDTWMGALIHLSLTLIYYYDAAYQMAIDHAEIAGQYFEKSSDKYGRMLTHFWRAMIAYKLDELGDLKRYGKKFIIDCVKYGYLFFLKKPSLYSPFDFQAIYPLLHILSEVLSGEPSMQIIEKKLQLADYLHHPGYQLYIKFMGDVVLYQAYQAVDESKWKREKAKELLAYLLLHPKAYIRKEEIFEALWEGADDQQANQQFKVTMNTLLTVLEPHRKARQPSFFIRRHQMMYGINPLAEINSDVKLFEKFIQEAEHEQDQTRRMAYYARAVELYQSSPFETFQDVRWIEKYREKLAQSYRQALEILADSALENADYKQAIIYAEEILADDLSEKAYQIIMQAYDAQGKRIEALKTYQACKKALQSHLDIQPAYQTQALAEKIKNQS